MSDFISEFMRSYGSKVSKNMSVPLGLDKKTIKQIIPQIAPLILGGLKKQKDEHGGTERIDHILNKYGNPDVLSDLAGLFRNKANDENPDPNLGGLLGNSGSSAANTIAKKFNVSGSTIMKLIPMLAPVILGALTKKRDRRNVGSTGIGALLDQNGDGSILDDVAGFILGNLSGSSNKKGGGILGSLLGGLFGKRN